MYCPVCSEDLEDYCNVMDFSSHENFECTSCGIMLVLRYKEVNQDGMNFFTGYLEQSNPLSGTIRR